MSYAKTDVEGFVRDGSSRAILNTDNTGYMAYKQRRKALSENQRLQNEVDSLKDDVRLLKSAIEKLLREQNK